jgi:type 1 glutamine amidotransferase
MSPLPDPRRSPAGGPSRRGRARLVGLGLAAVLAAAWATSPPDPPPARAADPPPKKVVLIAGEKSHAPNTHEYEKGVRLFKHCLDTSPNVRGVETVVVTNGWPDDAKVLDDAATILLFSDGSDIEAKKHPLLNGDRMAVFARQMKRGCGYVAIHYTTFTPKDLEERFLDWVGGYYDYETGPPPKHWWSKHVVDDYHLKPATPDHPVARGLEPFKLHEEFYFQMRFRQPDARRKNVLSFGDDDASAVAWAVERGDGGRGFAYTGGHFHRNWENDNVRRMVLNALLWTAKAEVPEGGVRSSLPRDWDEQFKAPPKKDKD